MHTAKIVAVESSNATIEHGGTKLTFNMHATFPRGEAHQLRPGYRIWFTTKPAKGNPREVKIAYWGLIERTRDTSQDEIGNDHARGGNGASSVYIGRQALHRM